MTDNSLGILDTHWEAYEVTSDATHRFLWMWHGFNIRVVAVPKYRAESMFYDFAWCYPRRPVLVVRHLLTWRPSQEDEPLGWHKRPGGVIRRAPERRLDPHYNRPRCVHGGYIEEGCRTFNCPGIRES